MASIWSQNRDVTQHPKRNNHDLSYSNHATFKFGYLYPVFKKPVVPGDSFSIDTAFDLKMMPIEFPVQSRVRAHMHFFYVRNKNLWKNWEDWSVGLRSNNECPHPYISLPDNRFKTGSIHDFLGQPTTVVNHIPSSEKSILARWLRGVPDGVYGCSYSGNPDEIDIYFDNDHISGSTGFILDKVSSLSHSSDFLISEAFNSAITDIGNTVHDEESVDLISISLQFLYDIQFDALNVPSSCKRIVMDGNTNAGNFVSRKVTLPDAFVNEVNRLIGLGHEVYPFVRLSFSSNGKYKDYTYLPNLSDSQSFYSPVNPLGVTEWSDVGLNCYRSNLLLNALPYRAYESIYRAFYANNVLQPLVIDGQKEFNKFNTTVEDGADTTDYHLFRRNYEYDFLTSALPSPQAGPAPLVGMSALGQITVKDENGVTTADAVLDEQGNVTGVTVTSPLASVEHGRTLMDIAQVGMNINDFRNVSALQKFLEQTLRSGYRYVDFIKGHFAVKPEYRELDMPEFLGGFTRDVEINTVVSQADTLLNNGGSTTGASLGDFSGMGRVVGVGKSAIRKYFDDYGWVIGILSITPTPAYSQLLPKENICPTNYLDYYHPEMAQLGYQPIPYSEVAPLQTALLKAQGEDVDYNDTFGYQRPNYNLVGSVDEVHGEFRRSLKDMLINRVFDGRPELGSEFLEINPSEINDIFVNQNPDDDVFIGHIAFRCHPKRPIPRIHIPGLGI